MLKKPDIIIVDDHVTFRQGIKFILTNDNSANVIGEASDGQAFLELLKDKKPDLVLMDIAMPNMDGLEATQKALALMPGLKIIVFTMFGNEEYFKKMTDLGVKGFILKSSSIDELEDAIEDVMRDNYFFSQELRRKDNNKTGHKAKH